MSRFREGEHVRVTIEGPVTQEALGSLYVDVGNGIQAEIPVEAPRVSIEHVAPSEWPPRTGDVWRDRHGSPWFAVNVTDTAETDVPEITMVAAHEDYRRTPDKLLQTCGPVTLVHREESGYE